MTDVVTETYERFYNSLLVQHILQHVRRHTEKKNHVLRNQRETDRKPSKPKRTTWQMFLDSLSVLCDHENGGETVAAIAVERTPRIKPDVTFWIAVNQRSRKGSPALHARDHLVYLLQGLKRITLQNEPGEGMMLDLFYTSVDKAKNRVNNYRKKLQDVLSAVKDRADEPLSDAPDKLLLEIIETLIDENKTVRSLCKKSSDFRSTDAARELARRARRDQTGSWKYICHFIGRLGAWLKAARFLAEHAADFADILSSPQTKIVPSEDCGKFAPPAEMWELETLL
ncbi:hypothetical protein LTS12_028004, partial [Elasticomyces elasticus]